MEKIKIVKHKNSKKQKVVIAFTAVGVIIFFGVWAVQLTTMFKQEFSGDVQQNWQESVAQIESGLDFVDDIESFLPQDENSLEGILTTLSEAMNEELENKKATEEISAGIISAVSENQEAVAAEEEMVTIEIENDTDDILENLPVTPQNEVEGESEEDLTETTP